MTIKIYNPKPKAQCPICGGLFLAEMLENHTRTCGSSLKKSIHRSRLRSRQIVAKFRHCDIILESKRGTGIGEGYCDRCGWRTNSLTRYRHSTVGVVDLCNACKAKVRDRSFEYIDVFSTGRVIGGFRW